MSMLVSYTQTPMVLDAVGALKVTHYYGRSALDDVYTYLRAFVLRGDLIFSLTAFEQTPPAESRIAVAFRFLPEKDPFFYLTVGPACPVEAFLSGSNGMVSLSLPQQGNRFGGSDEQGFYWGYEFCLPSSFLAKMGAKLLPGSVFTGNLYKYAVGESAFGAAFPCDPSLGFPRGENFGEFVVVPY